jgi:hypothetical protein
VAGRVNVAKGTPLNPRCRSVDQQIGVRLSTMMTSAWASASSPLLVVTAQKTAVTLHHNQRWGHHCRAVPKRAAHEIVDGFAGPAVSALDETGEPHPRPLTGGWEHFSDRAANELRKRDPQV